MHLTIHRQRMFITGALAACALAAWPQLSPAAGDPRDDATPWAFGSSAEWSGQYPKFNPLMSQAGARWVRLFPEWPGVEPKAGEWTWDGADKIVADAKANNLHVLGFWGYFAPYASADGGTRRGPIKSINLWRDYIRGTVAHFKGDIQYWEVWNEFNGSFYQGINKPKEYADLVNAAYDTAKETDPTAKIGMSVANFDVGFLDSAIKAGAANHFDYLCVHPYENLGTLAEGGEVGFLSLAGNLRDMLKANNQRTDMPLWITEVGYPAPVRPNAEADEKQAEVVVKGNLLSIAQGFQRVFWFEARGPSYGHNTDLGLIREDWTPRPAYYAYKTMTTLLGPEPKYLGWLNMGDGGYGFLFAGAHGTVLGAWAAPGAQKPVSFAAPVAVVDLAGKQSPLAAGQALTLTETPVFIYDPPMALVQQAQANLGKPYPWGGDYAHAQVVTCALGAVNRDDGLKETNIQTTTVVNGLSDSCRSTQIGNGRLNGEGHYVYFRVDPQFVPFGTTHLQITVVARRSDPSKSATANITYESKNKGYHDAGKRNEVPAGQVWTELNWELTDANFVGQWGWNFRIDMGGSPSDIYIKEVRVKKMQ